MESIRKPFQGVVNIVRFNWHFYVLSAAFVLLMLILSLYLNKPFSLYLVILSIIITAVFVTSLLTSFYVYDLSNLYKLSWLDLLPKFDGAKILNINAGFDETSALLNNKFPGAAITVFDFYDPIKHTEVSIKRARKAYPPYPGTQKIITSVLPLPDDYADKVFLILAAHEIRNEEERIVFFKELNRVLKPRGQVVVTEHLRDIPNFLAYNIGFLHFFPKRSWKNVFAGAGFVITKEIKITPFITTFILEKNGTAS